MIWHVVTAFCEQTGPKLEVFRLNIIFPLFQESMSRSGSATPKRREAMITIWVTAEHKFRKMPGWTLTFSVFKKYRWGWSLKCVNIVERNNHIKSREPKNDMRALHRTSTLRYQPPRCPPEGYLRSPYTLSIEVWDLAKINAARELGSLRERISCIHYEQAEC